VEEYDRNMIDSEYEAMKREAEAEQRYESNCWNPNGKPCKKCRFNGRCMIQDENEHGKNPYWRK